MMQRDAHVLRIDPTLPVPVYRQIVDGLRAMLINQQFVPGERLPTVRQLAEDLGVHHNTVAGAYRELAEEGWLELRRRRGAKVVLRDAPQPSHAAQPNFTRHLRELIAKARAEGVSTQTLVRLLERTTRELEEASS